MTFQEVERQIDKESGFFRKNYQVVKTRTEKLHYAFEKKYLELSGGVATHKRQQVWKDYLRKIEGIEYLARESLIGDAIEYLLDHLNNLGDEPFNQMVILDPCASHEKQFILIRIDVAEKILALGGLP